MFKSYKYLKGGSVIGSRGNNPSKPPGKGKQPIKSHYINADNINAELDIEKILALYQGMQRLSVNQQKKPKPIRNKDGKVIRWDWESRTTNANSMRKIPVELIKKIEKMYHKMNPKRHRSRRSTSAARRVKQRLNRNTLRTKMISRSAPHSRKRKPRPQFDPSKPVPAFLLKNPKFMAQLKKIKAQSKRTGKAPAINTSNAGPANEKFRPTGWYRTHREKVKKEQQKLKIKEERRKLQRNAAERRRKQSSKGKQPAGTNLHNSEENTTKKSTGSRK